MDQLIPRNTAAQQKISSLGYFKYFFHNPIKKTPTQNENKLKQNRKGKQKGNFKAKDHKTRKQRSEPMHFQQ